MNAPSSVIADQYDLMLRDLSRSGLTPEDLGARVLENAERAITSTPASTLGYTIPYLNILGQFIPFYRVRLFDFGDIKYKQPKETSNHIYFPKTFRRNLVDKNYIIITEGEKKAALACKLGFPTVGIGGVDSWRNRILRIPADSELSTRGPNLVAKIPSKGEVGEDSTSPLAEGLQALIDMVTLRHWTVYIVFDADLEFGVKPHVQRAAADLGFELRFRGIPFTNIRQLILPPEDETKVGLDDFLLEHGKEGLTQLIKETSERRSAFPRHPNIRDFLNKRLQKPKMARKEVQQIAMSILSDMDANGMRLISEEGNGYFYYFNFADHLLMRFQLSENANDVNYSTFGQYLYREFGLAGADHRLLTWLGAQFSGEPPIDRVTPYRIFARPPMDDQRIYYQVSDGQYVTISGDPNTTSGHILPGIEVFPNGDNGILFEADQVKPLDVKTMLMAYRKIAAESLTPWWGRVLDEVRLRDHDRQKTITMLLYYMSPWLYRWRGLQLPVEMVLGEPGTGKSSLYELRLGIISGEAKLRNAPRDIKDWHASISNSGGIHVTDNVQLTDRSIRQSMSDEICRIITEPNPIIEMRKYYTEADLRQIPVRVVFALTALQQPFTNADLLQRAVIVELDKPVNATFNSSWAQTQLHKFGGREAWVAHHLFILHKFLALVKTKWRNDYEALHRLVHFEQVMVLMAEVFGLDSSWIPEYLSGLINSSLTDADWAFEGLVVFCDYWREYGKGKLVGAQEISNWAQSMPEYEKNDYLTNTRKLGRYMKGHKSMLGQICNMFEAGTSNNRQMYRIEAPKS